MELWHDVIGHDIISLIKKAGFVGSQRSCLRDGWRRSVQNTAAQENTPAKVLVSRSEMCAGVLLVHHDDGPRI